MKTLGLRCSAKQYSFVVLDGTRENPMLSATATNPTPTGYSHSQALGWFLQEVHDLCKKHSIEVIILKGTEPMATRDASFVERVAFEAMAFLVGNDLGLEDTERKINVTIAKALHGKGKARYLKTMDTSSLIGFADLKEKEKEAALAAWSSL